MKVRLPNDILGHTLGDRLTAIWMTTTMMATDLVEWLRLLCLATPWQFGRQEVPGLSIIHARSHLVCRAQHRFTRMRKDG